MTDESSNTGKNRKPGTFAKGDPRINRNGRPKSFDQLRALAQEIAHEVARAKDKRTGEEQEVIINGKRATVAEMILRQMATDPKRQQQFIEVAFGKVPQPVEMGIEKELLELLRDGRITPSDIRAFFPDVALPVPGIEA